MSGPREYITNGRKSIGETFMAETQESRVNHVREHGGFYGRHEEPTRAEDGRRLWDCKCGDIFIYNSALKQFVTWKPTPARIEPLPTDCADSRCGHPKHMHDAPGGACGCPSDTLTHDYGGEFGVQPLSCPCKGFMLPAAPTEFGESVAENMPGIVLSAKQGKNADLFPEILRLYVSKGSTVLDMTYGQGAFWSKVDFEGKLYPNDMFSGKGGYAKDFRATDWPDAMFDCVILDPPYAYSPKRTVKESIAKCYGLNNSVDISTMAKVQQLYADGIKEARRLLKPNGHLIVKTQDIIQAGKQWWMHVWVMQQEGFSCEDLFVLMQSNKPTQDPKWKRQLHARKNHSFFVVLRKEAERNTRPAPAEAPAEGERSEEPRVGDLYVEEDTGTVLEVTGISDAFVYYELLPSDGIPRWREPKSFLRGLTRTRRGPAPTAAPHGGLPTLDEETQLKRKLALILDGAIYGDSYGVEGSEFSVCRWCGGGSSPGKGDFSHNAGCLMDDAVLEAQVKSTWEYADEVASELATAQAEHQALRENVLEEAAQLCDTFNPRRIGGFGKFAGSSDPDNYRLQESTAKTLAQAIRALSPASGSVRHGS